MTPCTTFNCILRRRASVAESRPETHSSDPFRVNLTPSVLHTPAIRREATSPSGNISIRIDDLLPPRPSARFSEMKPIVLSSMLTPTLWWWSPLKRVPSGTIISMTQSLVLLQELYSPYWALRSPSPMRRLSQPGLLLQLQSQGEAATRYSASRLRDESY